VGNVTGCLDDETMLGLMEGRLGALDVVEAHLDGCEACRALVGELARSRAADSHALHRGGTIGVGGRYVIGELLGSGAMGHVYSAWQPELDRRVAIKVLHDDATTGHDRLLREAQAMARLDHPNVVGVHEVGALDDGGVFVVMDLVEGDTLRAWARDRKPAELIRVLIEIARGLAAVHATGVIHRDIKPDNIIVGLDGRARLGDFGLARGTATRATGRPADDISFEDTAVAIGPREGVTAAGTPRSIGTAIAGTPVYMAAELLRGGAATPASDQFAFGVTAYEIIAGARPFAGTTWSELVRAIESTEPPALRAVPGWLDTAIRRCFAADPARRFSSMTAVADHLAASSQRRRSGRWIAGALAAATIASGATWYVAGRGRGATGPSCTLGATEIATIWNPATRARVSTLGPPTLAALDGWATRWATEHDAVCAAAVAGPPVTIAARQHCLVRQRTELAALLDRAALPGSRPAAAVSSTVSEHMLDALATLVPADCRDATPGTADPIPADPDRAAAAREVESALPAMRAAIALGDARPVADSTAQLVERARASEHAPTLAEALLVRADALRATARLPDAARAARDAVVAAERGHDDATAARAWLARVALAADRRDLDAADDLIELASAAIDRAGAPPRLAARLIRLRAQVAYNRGRYDRATALLADARLRYLELSGEGSLDLAAIESAAGSVARAAGDLDVAETDHRAALAIDRALRGPSHPDVARDLHNLGGVLRLRGKLDAAAATYRQALAIEIATRGELGVEAGLTHNSLGLVAIARGRLGEARSELELARTALTAAGHGDRAFAIHNLGIVAAASGDHLAAVALYDQAAAVFDATTGADVTSAIRLHLDRARSLAALGRRDAARAEATRAVDDATRAEIPWIAEDARALLSGARPPPRPHLEVAVEPRQSLGKPIAHPDRAPEPPIPPQPPQPKPRPRRDVGSYGASQP